MADIVLSMNTRVGRLWMMISVHTEKGEPTMDERDVKIIIALADNRMNVTEVSRILFMHRNTVSYHVGKIKRITGLDPLNFYDLCDLLNMVSGERREGE